MLRQTRNDDAIWIQIDDQMDAKSLVGAYVCTSTPGEFRWQPGPLAEVYFTILPITVQCARQAVSHGKWLIVEDINVAPPEVLASLIPLLENGRLAIPQRAETLNIRDGFHLIATVTCAPERSGVGTYGSADAIKVHPIPEGSYRTVMPVW